MPQLCNASPSKPVPPGGLWQIKITPRSSAEPGSLWLMVSATPCALLPLLSCSGTAGAEGRSDAEARKEPELVGCSSPWQLRLGCTGKGTPKWVVKGATVPPACPCTAARHPALAKASIFHSCSFTGAEATGDWGRGRHGAEAGESGAVKIQQIFPYVAGNAAGDGSRDGSILTGRPRACPSQSSLPSLPQQFGDEAGSNRVTHGRGEETQKRARARSPWGGEEPAEGFGTSTRLCSWPREPGLTLI